MLKQRSFPAGDVARLSAQFRWNVARLVRTETAKKRLHFDHEAKA